MARSEKESSIDATAEFKVFSGWLAKQPLSDRSRRAYGDQVRNYLQWLEDRGSGAEALAIVRCAILRFVTTSGG